MSDDVVFKAQLCVFFFKLHLFSSNEISSGSCSVISLIYQSLEFIFILRAVLGDPRQRDISAVLQRRDVLGLVLAEVLLHFWIQYSYRGSLQGENWNKWMSELCPHPPTSSAPMMLLRMAIILFFAQKWERQKRPHILWFFSFRFLCEI